MSWENDDRSSLDEALETSCQAQKQSKTSYSREFLLSLSELEICKKLPGSFDASILSELEDASYVGQDRQRIPGSSPFQGFRRSEYSSSPPTRGDSGNYSRNTYGKWESRSSGRSDRDSDTCSDRDSDSGQRHGNPPRQSWQSSEHDGLLGSGSFPRSSGHASGMPAPKARANDHFPLNRSNEPYHPPRPYKAVPFLRRDTKDSFNDETFGSSEGTSEDRVEEERRRRASFELMRKEQQKALQEKQKLNPEKQKGDSISDISVLLDDTREEKGLFGGSDLLEGSANPAVPTNDSGKSTIISQTTTSRPLVPPGFANTIVEKNFGPKSLIHTHKAEVGKPESEESLVPAQPKTIDNGTVDSLERESSQDTTFSEDKTVHVSHMDQGEKVMSIPLSLEASDLKLVMGDHSRTSSLSGTHESLDDPGIVEITAKVSDGKIQGDLSPNNSPIILEKIFGSALAMNLGGPVASVEDIDSKPDETWTSNSIQSSKFAQWFLEEESKPGNDFSDDRPNDLLSLIVGGDKGRPQLAHIKATGNFPLEVSHENSELATNFMSGLSSTENGISEQLYESSKMEATPTVLTCEDLELKMLLEYTEKSSNKQQSLQEWGVAGVKSELPNQQVDSHASRQLLSLLQKGTSLNQVASSPGAEVDSDKILISQGSDVHASREENREEDDKSIHTSGKTLTLETLFGSAFMQELQSVEAPVSVQRGLVGSSQTSLSEPPGLSFPLMDNGSSMSSEAGPHRTSHQNDILPLNHGEENRLVKIESWLGLKDPQMQLNSSKHQIEVNSKHGGINKSIEFHLPEEESLTAVGDPLNPQNSMIIPARTSSKSGLSSNAPIDVAGKLATIGAVAKQERYPVVPEGSSFVHGTYNRIEPEIPQQSLHVQPSMPLSHSSQMNHGKPLFYPLDSHPTHMNSQMKFMGPESVIHHDFPANHQFATNMIRPHVPHPNASLTAYDISAPQSVLPQMQIPGTFPLHPSHEFQRSHIPHPGSQGSVLMPELNSMQGFSVGPDQLNVAGLGMAMQASDINSGSNHSDAFQRLLEMELRAKSKQIHPLPLGHSQPTYSHELDMGFRYR